MFLIHINRPHLIRSEATPAILIKRSDDERFYRLCKTVEILGPSALRQAYPGEPLPFHDVRAWLETAGPLVADGERIEYIETNPETS